MGGGGRPECSLRQTPQALCPLRNVDFWFGINKLFHDQAEAGRCSFSGSRNLRPSLASRRSPQQHGKSYFGVRADWNFPFVFHLCLTSSPCCSCSIFPHRAHISCSILWCDLMSWVWRIKAGAFGVASISWKSSIAGSNLFIWSFESNKIVWTIFLWIISLQLGPKPPVYMKSVYFTHFELFFFCDIYLDFAFYRFELLTV